MSNVRTCVREQGLDQYADAFEENDVTLDLVRDLIDGDLEDLGVAFMGHRRTLLRAIRSLSVPPLRWKPASLSRPTGQQRVQNATSFATIDSMSPAFTIASAQEFSSSLRSA